MNIQNAILQQRMVAIPFKTKEIKNNKGEYILLLFRYFENRKMCNLGLIIVAACNNVFIMRLIKKATTTSLNRVLYGIAIH